MSLLDSADTWQFARSACPVAECADHLALLLKQLKRRTKQADDPLFGMKCVKQDKHAEICFHPIDVERASQCLIVALHAFPPQSPAAVACFEIGTTEGCHRWMRWQAKDLTADWVIYKQAGAPSRLSWEQSVPEDYSPAADEWAPPWREAAQLLGAESLLGEIETEGLLMPVLLGEQVSRKQISSTWSSQLLTDARGFQVAVVSRRKGHLSVTLLEAEPARVDELWLTAMAATAKALGPPARQLLNVSYNGRQTAISEQLNAASPCFHRVSYILHDNERDQFYRDMLKPLQLPAGIRRVFPAIALQRDEQPVFLVNVVRTRENCWLEFQAEESVGIFSWIQQTLDREFEAANGAVAGCWGW